MSVVMADGAGGMNAERLCGMIRDVDRRWAVQREEVLAILSRHREELRGLGVKSLAVFGSAARNEARPESDVDLLVEFDRPIGLFHFVDVQLRLSELLGGVEVDLVMRESVIEELREDIYAEATDVL